MANSSFTDWDLYTVKNLMHKLVIDHVLLEHAQSYHIRL